jgi:hypothetical protein
MVYELAAASDSQHRFCDPEKQSDVASQPDGLAAQGSGSKRVQGVGNENADA